MPVIRISTFLLGFLVLLILLPNLSASAIETSLHFFYAENCPHCKEEKPFLEQLQAKHPQLQVVIHDVWLNKSDLKLMREISEAHGVDLVSTPLTAVGEQIWIGYTPEIATAIEEAIERCLLEGCRDPLAFRDFPAKVVTETEHATTVTGSPVDPDRYSLPVFTVLLGLLDSFNPCAFFVLLFLLSLMVHARSRKQMFLVGGTFVFFSGLIYFLFMAAWLNIFLLAGQLPLITTIAGFVALFIAVGNIKDFFLFHKGLSLSMPEHAKPHLFERMRNLLKGEQLGPVLLGTTVLAVVANSYELLCTAGFPMVFTRVLTLRNLETLEYYGYLLLYNVVYVLPLIIIVTIFTLTLGSHKLSEKEGRMLKLLSGNMMLTLGSVLVIRPQLLQNLHATVALIGVAILVTGVVLMIDKKFRSSSDKPDVK